MTFELTRVDPPKLTAPLANRTVDASVFSGRIGRLRRLMAKVGLEVLVVYGDREHFGNLHYLTGYDPRFEEALLVLHSGTEAFLLVGNEGMGYSEVSPLGLKRLLCQNFSLLGQSRREAPRLDQVLRKAGLVPGAATGVIGWKYFLDIEADRPDRTLDVPSFIADAIRGIATPDKVVNATALMMHPANGLRTRVELEQILAFAPTCQAASQGIFRAIAGIEAGEAETDVARRFSLDGRPMSFHPIVTSGDRTALGLASPSNRKLARGDRVFMAVGGWGANTVRGGYLLSSPREVEVSDPGYVEDVVGPYLDMVAAWYEGVKVGAVAGDVHASVTRRISGRIAGFALNPGHHIHVDEWVSSPFEAGSDVVLTSGMMMQLDIIPVVEKGGFGTNAEDGVVLADADLRAALELASPAL